MGFDLSQKRVTRQANIVRHVGCGHTPRYRPELIKVTEAETRAAYFNSPVGMPDYRDKLLAWVKSLKDISGSYDE